MSADVDIKADYVLQGDTSSLSINLRPRWDKLEHKGAILGPEQRKNLSHFFAAEAYEYLYEKLKEETQGNRLEGYRFIHQPKDIPIQINADDSVTFTIKFDCRETKNEPKFVDYIRKQLRRADAETLFFDACNAATAGGVAFGDIEQLFHAAKEMEVIPGITRDNLQGFLESPEERQQVQNWLEEHGIRVLSYLDSGPHSLTFETNGEFAVQIKTKKHKALSGDVPQVIKPLFSMKTAHANVDIVPRVKGKTLAAKDEATINNVLDTLSDVLASQGKQLIDQNARNVMFMPDGTPFIVDRSAVKAAFFSTALPKDWQCPYSWVMPDGKTPKQHVFYPWVADNTPDKAIRFTKEVMNTGRYTVPHEVLNEKLQDARTYLSPNTCQRIDAAIAAYEASRQAPSHLPADHRPRDASAIVEGGSGRSNFGIAK